MEIIYQLNSISKLKNVNEYDAKWLTNENDIEHFNRILLEQTYYTQKKVSFFEEMSKQGITYCGLFVQGKIVARACVERYGQEQWETCDVRVLRKERNKGYGSQITHFVTKYILEQGKIAICRTEETNHAMRNIIANLGFEIMREG